MIPNTQLYSLMGDPPEFLDSDIGSVEEDEYMSRCSVHSSQGNENKCCGVAIINAVFDWMSKLLSIYYHREIIKGYANLALCPPIFNHGVSVRTLRCISGLLNKVCDLLAVTDSIIFHLKVSAGVQHSIRFGILRVDESSRGNIKIIPSHAKLRKMIENVYLQLTAIFQCSPEYDVNLCFENTSHLETSSIAPSLSKLIRHKNIFKEVFANAISDYLQESKNGEEIAVESLIAIVENAIFYLEHALPKERNTVACKTCWAYLQQVNWELDEFTNIILLDKDKTAVSLNTITEGKRRLSNAIKSFEKLERHWFKLHTEDKNIENDVLKQNHCHSSDKLKEVTEANSNTVSCHTNRQLQNEKVVYAGEGIIKNVQHYHATIEKDNDEVPEEFINFMPELKARLNKIRPRHDLGAEKGFRIKEKFINKSLSPNSENDRISDDHMDAIANRLEKLFSIDR